MLTARISATPGSSGYQSNLPDSTRAHGTSDSRQPRAWSRGMTGAPPEMSMQWEQLRGRATTAGGGGAVHKQLRLPATMGAADDAAVRSSGRRRRSRPRADLVK